MLKRWQDDSRVPREEDAVGEKQTGEKQAPESSIADLLIKVRCQLVLSHALGRLMGGTPIAWRTCLWVCAACARVVNRVHLVCPPFMTVPNGRVLGPLCLPCLLLHQLSALHRQCLAEVEAEPGEPLRHDVDRHGSTHCIAALGRHSTELHVAAEVLSPADSAAAVEVGKPRHDSPSAAAAPGLVKAVVQFVEGALVSAGRAGVTSSQLLLGLANARAVMDEAGHGEDVREALAVALGNAVVVMRERGSVLTVRGDRDTRLVAPRLLSLPACMLELSTAPPWARLDGGGAWDPDVLAGIARHVAVLVYRRESLLEKVEPPPPAPLFSRADEQPIHVYSILVRCCACGFRRRW
jgi:hypothetical protein